MSGVNCGATLEERTIRSMRERFDAVVLDMDGLLVDSEVAYCQAWQSATSQLGFELRDDVFLDLVGRGNAEGEALLAARLGPAFPVERFQPLWRGLWSEYVGSHGLPTKPGARELLAFLVDSHLPFGLATSSEADAAAFTLRAAGIDDTLFGCIVTGDQVEHAKPAPDIYLEAARCLGVKPARCLAVEDSDAGIVSATTAGMQAIQVPDLKPPTAVPPGVHVLPSLIDVMDWLRSDYTR
jgi:beta-phosphoglucomutase